MNRLGLREIESRSWKAAQRNGLFDLFFGALFLTNALSMLLEDIGVADAVRISVSIALYAGGIIGFWLARRRYVLPRIGTARLGSRRRGRIRAMRAVLAVSVLATLSLAVLLSLARLSPAPWSGALGDYGSSSLVGIIILVSLTALAYTLNAPHLVLHAMLFVGAEFATVALGRASTIPFPGTLAFGVAAAASLTVGAVVFTRFLRDVPRKASLDGRPFQKTEQKL